MRIDADVKINVNEEIHSLVSSIEPFDYIEHEHIQDTLNWISSGAQLFRIAKPDVPNKHLVSYFVLFDSAASKILLVDHKKAQLWLPSGGHVEEGEDPKSTVERECYEELRVYPEFFYPDPLFLTSTITVGLTAGHTDVSLWYVVKGDHRTNYVFDLEEFNTIAWFDLDKIPFERSDPHMRRFIQKLQTHTKT